MEKTERFCRKCGLKKDNTLFKPQKASSRSGVCELCITKMDTSPRLRKKWQMLAAKKEARREV